MTNLILTTPAELRAIVAEEVSKAVAGLVQEPTVTEPAAPLMTRRAVADYLSVSVSTVDNYAREGLLTKVPFGERGVRFDRGEVERLAKINN